jgi:subtilisin family serine protease
LHSGNEGYNLDYSKIYPASYFLPNQIIVAASDFNDDIWRPADNPMSFRRDTGRPVHLAAPGVSVLTTQARGDCFLCTQETDPVNWYTSASGTSVSAACVSGVAALAKSTHPNDSAILLKRRIIEGVEVAPNLLPHVLGGGRLSAIGALTSQLNISPPTLQEVTYKTKKQKLSVYGSGMQSGLNIIVGKSAYPGRPQSDDGTSYLAKGVPVAAFPKGLPVQIKLRNPDGGESPAITFTR